ncbi:unnamed protein product [Oppiella nova]|uniref:Uncharacterized protein n=1 Tax=Oppiella nova TaxID=334625 RepID=A0A7R9MH47_9ACAR|nr:unnamed protein product [Oppiella nova]CAG2177173.1 unnamed protein product [Oppiella nova]
MFGTRFASIHTGQSYLPVLMTPLCYGPHFPFTNISQITTSIRGITFAALLKNNSKIFIY